MAVRSNKALRVLGLLGLNPPKMGRTLRGLPAYFRDMRSLKEQQKHSQEEFPFGKLYPCLEDRYLESGTASGQYFHQDIYVARKVFSNNPKIHVDVGSRVDGFISHLAVFRTVEVLDIRPLQSATQNIKFVQADLMADLDPSLVEYCDSLSCLHAIEHFGLGRYGDPVNFDGHLLGLKNLQKLLKHSGKFYFSVPIGPQRIEFNAHRVFSMEYLLGIFDGIYTVDSFSYIDDSGVLHEGAALSPASIKSNFGCKFGLGIFEMTKA